MYRLKNKAGPKLLNPGEKQIAIAYSQSSMNADFNKTMKYVVLGYFVDGKKPENPLISLPFNITTTNAAQLHFKCAKTFEYVDGLVKWYQTLADAVNTGDITFEQAWWIAMLTQSVSPDVFKQKLLAGYVPYFYFPSGKTEFPIRWVKLRDAFGENDFGIKTAIKYVENSK